MSAHHQVAEPSRLLKLVDQPSADISELDVFDAFCYCSHTVVLFVEGISHLRENLAEVLFSQDGHVCVILSPGV